MLINKKWDVKFDKSAYNETYRAHFIFKPKMKRNSVMMDKDYYDDYYK